MKRKTIEIVEAFEAIELGDSYADALKAARASVAAAVESAQAELFPHELRPQSADVFAAIRFHSERWNAGPHYAAGLLELHARSLTSWPELAAGLRAHDMLEEVAEAAAAWAQRVDRDATELAEETRRSCRAALAAQLAEGKHELSSKASEYLDALALEPRVNAAHDRHTAHVESALEAEEALRREAEERRIQESNREISAAIEAIDSVRVAGRRAGIEAEKKLAALLIERIEQLGRSPAATVRVGGEKFAVEYLLARLRGGVAPEFLQRLAASLTDGRA